MVSPCIELDCECKSGRNINQIVIVQIKFLIVIATIVFQDTSVSFFSFLAKAPYFAKLEVDVAKLQIFFLDAALKPIGRKSTDGLQQ